MRLRHNQIRQLKSKTDILNNEVEDENDTTEKDSVKVAKPIVRDNLGFLRRIVSNPNFAFQIMVIILTLASDNVRMDRRIDTMTTKIDAIRGIADVINNTMQSVKVASEAPKHIRKLLQ